MFKKKSRLLRFNLSFLMLTCTLAAFGEGQPAIATGKWQISWEARLGTERGTLQLEQVGSKLTGSFQGRLGSPKISGNIEGKNIDRKSVV